MSRLTLDQYFASCYAELIFQAAFLEEAELTEMISVIPNSTTDIRIVETDYDTQIIICDNVISVVANDELKCVVVSAFGETIHAEDTYEIEQLLLSNDVMPSNVISLTDSALSQFFVEQLDRLNITDIVQARYDNLRSDDDTDNSLELLSYLNCYLNPNNE